MKSFSPPFFARWLHPSFAVALLMVSIQLKATPAGDPICGTPSSLDLVRAIRAQMAAQTSARRNPLRAQQIGGQPHLTIERPSGFDLPRLLLSGGAGQTYQLEGTANLASGQWKSWLSVILGDQPLSWTDDAMLAAPFQFYRLRAGEPDAFADSASNFRLLDHQGVARDLYYHTHLDAIVVLAAGTNLNQVAPLVPLLDEFAKTYSDRMQTWILLSDPAPVRSNIAAQAKALNIDSPIVFDRHGLAARAVGLTHAGEVALVQPPAFTIAYRGEVSGSGQVTAVQSYLGQALSSLNSGLPQTFLRTPIAGEPLGHVTSEVPNYAREIAPVLYKYCANCHRPDGVAPFALTNYSVVEMQATSIKHALASGKMPPWHADPEYGRFANDLSLPGELRAALIRWIDAGAPRGVESDPLADLPPPPAYDEWPPELGEPDALVTVPLQPIKATGSEPYRYIFVQSPNPSNVWLRAAIVRHSNYRAVHHSLIWLGRIGNNGTPDNSSYQPHFAEFVPGCKQLQFPNDSYVSLTRSNWLTFNLHYNTIGTSTNDQPVLALWYHKTKPPKIWKSALIGTADFAIPPENRDFGVQAPDWTAPSTITLHRLNPHMHLRGKRMKYEVVHRDGRRETILSVPDYDFNWQLGYQLAEPKVLPAGSRIVVSGAFDNSPQNLANPDPSATVVWGDQSWMEMFVGFIDYTQ